MASETETARRTSRGRAAPRRTPAASSGQSDDADAATTVEGEDDPVEAEDEDAATDEHDEDEDLDEADDGQGRGAFAALGISAASAAIGAAGGMLVARALARRAARAPKVTMEFKGLAAEVGEAGRQFNRLAKEVIAVGAAAERVGKSLNHA